MDKPNTIETAETLTTETEINTIETAETPTHDAATMITRPVTCPVLYTAKGAIDFARMGRALASQDGSHAILDEIANLASDEIEDPDLGAIADSPIGDALAPLAHEVTDRVIGSRPVVATETLRFVAAEHKRAAVKGLRSAIKALGATEKATKGHALLGE